MAEILLCFRFALSALCCFSPPTRSQVQKVLQFHRELPREELHAAPTNRAAAEAPLHPRPAQRAAGPHTAQRPHRPDEEKEGRERCACFSIIMQGWKSVGCVSCEWLLVFVHVQMRLNMSTVAVRRRKRILLSKKESPGMFYTCSISLKGNKCTCSGGGVSQSSNLFVSFLHRYSSIVNVPGESTLRRDFIRLQQENKERSEALRHQQLLQEQQLREQEEYKRQLLAERQKRIEQQKEQRRRLEEVGFCFDSLCCFLGSFYPVFKLFAPHSNSDANGRWGGNRSASSVVASKKKRGVWRRWIVDVKRRRNAGRTRREGTIVSRSVSGIIFTAIKASETRSEMVCWFSGVTLCIYCSAAKPKHPCICFKMDF